MSKNDFHLKKFICIFFVFILISTSCGEKTQQLIQIGEEVKLSTPIVEKIFPTSTVIPVPTPTSEPTLSPIEITATAEVIQHEENLRIFDQFIADLKTGEAGKIVGIWIENVLALKVVYQPSNNLGFVSTIDETATYFLYPWQKAGNHGLLAHNYLAGRYFFNVQVGDIVTLVFGDGDYEDFEVTSINEYQALQPNSPYSNFIDQSTGEQLTATNLFIEVYMGEYHTTLQTCIAVGAETEWGRRFILAPPMY